MEFLLRETRAAHWGFIPVHAGRGVLTWDREARRGKSPWQCCWLGRGWGSWGSQCPGIIKDACRTGLFPCFYCFSEHGIIQCRPVGVLQLQNGSWQVSGHGRAGGAGRAFPGTLPAPAALHSSVLLCASRAAERRQGL